MRQQTVSAAWDPSSAHIFRKVGWKLILEICSKNRVLVKTHQTPQTLHTGVQSLKGLYGISFLTQTMPRVNQLSSPQWPADKLEPDNRSARRPGSHQTHIPPDVLLCGGIICHQPTDEVAQIRVGGFCYMSSTSSSHREVTTQRLFMETGLFLHHIGEKLSFY